MLPREAFYLFSALDCARNSARGQQICLLVEGVKETLDCCDGGTELLGLVPACE
jgi:hypothetical protein